MRYIEVILRSKSDRPFLCDVRWDPDGKKKAVVIFIHGFKGFKDWGHFNLIADQFARNGYIFGKLNLSHNGTTPETPMDFADLEAFSKNTFSKELDDIGDFVDAFVDYDLVPSKEVDKEHVYLIGHSRGGGLALMKAGEDNRIGKVASWAGIHDLGRRWKPEFIEQWEKDGVFHVLNGRTKQNMPILYDLYLDYKNNFPRLDIPYQVEKLDIPVLVVHGTNDETLHVDMAYEINDWAKKGELYIMDGANHTFGGKHPWERADLPDDARKIVDRTIEFFNKN